MDKSPQGIDADAIKDEFPIDVDSAEPISIPGLKESTRVFRVRRPEILDELYIIDTLEGRDIACHPHIVGWELSWRAHACARESVKAIDYLTDVLKGRNKIVFGQILRACLGYELDDEFRKLSSDKDIRDVWIRPKYFKSSYRDHEGATKDIRIVFEDFRFFPKGENVVLIIQDTVASGRSCVEALNRFLEYCEKCKTTISELYLYGFLSSHGLKSIGDTAKRNDIKVRAFAIGNVTDLAYNMYDMPVYGLDESYYKAFGGKMRKLGCVIHESTLERYLPEYPPGSDQPGDFSARQTWLLTCDATSRFAYVPGNIRQHLKNSRKLLKNLQKMSRDEPWYSESWHGRIFENELNELQTILNSHI